MSSVGDKNLRTMKKKLSFLFVLFLTCSFSLFAQVTVKGVVIDKDTKESLIGATISVPAEKKDVITDLDGSFTLKLSKVGDPITISYIGYHSKTIKSVADMGEIELESSAIGLDDVVVTSSVAIRRKTPVALSVVEPEFIEAKLSTQEFPEILKSTPGIYATKEGGGFGDAKMRLRGFESENIAVMINGAPMNDMEWGGLYWSNWAGLSDVTRSMQVQRGLGAAKVASPSIGGSVNIVTNSTDAKRGGHVYYGLANDGYNKIAASFSTGLTDKGWAMSFLGSKTWGDGYIMGTEFESYTWFVNISKIINHDHRISFTGFGTPQWHNQRKDQLNIKEWRQLGIKDFAKFNATYGFDSNGERVNANRNRYHKPQFSLNHMWTMNEKSSLSNVVYMSIGDGGGRRWRGKNYTDLYGSSQSGELNWAYRDPLTKYVDYGKVRQENFEGRNGSENVISESINNHIWLGLLSTFTTKLTDNIELYGGLDIRYYAGEHTEEIIDLMGGKYFIDTYRNDKAPKAIADPNWKNQKLMVGDKIYRDNTGYVAQEGFFSQAEYNKDKLSTFIALSGSLSTYWREERYYEDHAESKSKTFPSFTVKGGANYNLDKKHNVFFNTGFMSRAPFMQNGYFTNMNQSNVTNPAAVNEKSYSVEIGYGYRSSIFTANLNLYHTKWMDKLMVKRDASTESFINLSGVDARHQGIELEFVLRPMHNLDIKGMVSIGDWIWDSKAEGYAYDSNGNPLGGVPEFSDAHRVSIDLKDVRVGNSAQTTLALGANYKIPFLDNLTIGADYTYSARNYAKYGISMPDIGKSSKYYTPWKIPSAGVLDMNASYKMNVVGLDMRLMANVNNVLNKEYIADALEYNPTNPEGTSWQDIPVYYGFGRTYSVALKVSF